MSNEENLKAEKAGRDMNTDGDTLSEDLGTRLADRLLGIPAVKKFCHQIKRVHGIDTSRAARSFRKRFLEGL